MVDDADRVREVFDLSGFTYMENDILGVELPSESDPFARVFSALLSAELNINYTYPLLYRRHGQAAIAMHLDDIDQAGEVLTQLGYRLVTENDLMDNDDCY
ncbi:MAG: acetolactate synthase [Planctomycetota bacterium]|nr:MAG: acetolactate synthase [Planctomycetota bacterium]